MITDNLRTEASAAAMPTPMQIARHTLLDAREKLDLLYQLRADAAALEAEAHEFGFSPGEIEDAIAEVRRGIETGEGTAKDFKGD